MRSGRGHPEAFAAGVEARSPAFATAPAHRRRIGCEENVERRSLFGCGMEETNERYGASIRKS
jgi:hypothetical protein